MMHVAPPSSVAHTWVAGYHVCVRVCVCVWRSNVVVVVVVVVASAVTVVVAISSMPAKEVVVCVVGGGGSFLVLQGALYF